ncbi:MAG TPA: Hsp70 family protein, partial [Actinomycetota bacterium]|nr:Hsp70 family protein [Actinomycetota bacterium]
MIQEAEAHAAEDKKRRERVEIRNQADALAYQVEKGLKDLGDKIPADEKAKVEASLERTREALKHDDEAELKAALEELRGRWSEATTHAYEAAGAAEESSAAGGPQPEPGEAEAPEEDVIEADYEVVDEEK